MKNISIKISNYKCFDAEPQGFEALLPLNIIIGRNNSGKSSLLELIHSFTGDYDLSKNARKNRTYEILINRTITEATIRKVFPAGRTGGGILGDHYAFGSQWIDKRISYSYIHGKKKYLTIEPDFPKNLSALPQEIVDALPNIIDGIVFKQIRAERKITPEEDQEIKVSSDGEGATNIIQNFLNKATLPSDLVEMTLLQELNRIMNPDSYFRDIVVQQLENKEWEIFLEEENKGRIALSQSGSGLQTILLVLIFIYLIPFHEKRKLDKYFFAFEELENNLHPSLQRRLFQYIKDIAINNNTHFFITTHSNVVIDLFSKDENAQILHLTHNSVDAKVKLVKTYGEQRGILDDLDIRASDLLQSDCIVWVEGPSDRLYLNHWIKLWSNSKLVEGNHYQCVFYGGRLLSHLSANNVHEDFEKYIQILLVNKNAILIMDSDKNYRADKINSTKERIILEMKKVQAYPWLTRGKEIENYLSVEALKKYLQNNDLKNLSQYESFPSYLEKHKKGAREKFLNDKVMFAERIREYLTLENLKEVLDLDSQMKYVIKKIREWNHLV